ncbi:MAG TPA: GntR family transcriptional regulator [Solirubrobacterales bacterium]|jgi:DNA-binding GntR family transcriptional regulator|nr:GntR family transcriptional regulator [Solirubrobacterales bacterium]
MASEHGTSVERVHRALRENILSGSYPPGSRLILARLAREHEVSFIPVREALQRLEAERLVRIERNRGATVTEISIPDMKDIYETRLLLEQSAIRSAVASISPAQLRAAETALRRMRARFRKGEAAAAYAAHEDFHFGLYEAAGSPWTVHLVRQLWSSAERYVRLAASVRPDPDRFVDEHAEILAAVQRGDGDAAANRLADNLRTTEDLLAQTYDSGSSDQEAAG